MAETYSRIYWRFIDEYPDVYDDDRAFATWVRLLILAEGTHPQPAQLPRKVGRASLNTLIEAGLVVLLAGDRYRIKGLAAERERRAEQGRKGATARWTQSEGNANALPTHSERTATAMPAKQSRDEQSKDETRTTSRAPGMERGVSILPDVIREEGEPPPEVLRLAKLAAEITGLPFVSPYSGFIENAKADVQRHGFDHVERAWRQIANRMKAEGTSTPTLRQLVFGADEILNPVPRVDDKEQREEQERSRFDKRVEATRRRIAENQPKTEKEPA